MFFTFPSYKQTNDVKITDDIKLVTAIYFK